MLNIHVKKLMKQVMLFLFMASLFQNQILAGQNSENVSLNEDSLLQFINDYMQEEMETHHIAGAAVAVIKDDKEILKRGYGYSNLEQKTPVDPDSTTFPIASVSKLFTALGIMQLSEQGKIDLQEDAQKYIGDIKIKNPYKRKVTCSNLLTHSSGMDEGDELLGSTTNQSLIKPQKAYFKNHSLNIIERPDTVSCYSNLGYNLLGYIIERQGKSSYETYVQKHILEPLEMNHSSVRIHDEHMANGYVYAERQYQKVPYAYQYTSGSAGVIGTAADMENFMRMFLNKGSFKGKRLLKEETVNMMEKKMFSNDDILPGMGYGFVRVVRNGRLILKHEGALPGYMSTLLMVPEEKLGIFITVNTFDALPFRFEEEFLNRFFPREQTACKSFKNKDNIKKYEGVYRNYDGIAQTNLMKMAILFDQTTDTKIKANTDGTLRLEEYNQQKEKGITNLTEIDNGRFIRADGGGYYAIRQRQGDSIYAFNEVSHNAYKKVHIYEEKTVLWGIIVGAVIVSLIDLWKNLMIILKRKKTYGLSIINIAAIILMFTGTIGSIGLILNMINEYDYHLIGMLYVLLTMILLSAIWNIGRLISYIVSWHKNEITFKGLIYQLGVISVSLLYCGVLNYCNLIGYHI